MKTSDKNYLPIYSIAVVKVDKDWRKNENQLKAYGYINQK